ncbi:hypothetical protein ACFVJJ_36595, partial [Streptomyces sp. NPDC127532]
MDDRPALRRRQRCTAEGGGAHRDAVSGGAITTAAVPGTPEPALRAEVAAVLFLAAPAARSAG